MSELSYEASDEASENELLERSLSVWRGWGSIKEDFTPIPLDIHTASSIGQYDCVRTLIARGEVEIDRKNVGGWTPLMYACYIGHDHIVSLLIDGGCNVNLRNQRGQTPLMLAASCGNESVGRILLRKGAELEAVDREGWTALFHATYSGHQNFVSFLLDQRANTDAAEPGTGLTPLMCAAIEGHEIIVQTYLQHGVNVNARAFSGDTARSLALAHSYMKIVSLIDNHVMPHSSLRSEPGLGDYLSSSDELEGHKRPLHQRNSRSKAKAGPSIRDGPEAIARMIDRTRSSEPHTHRPHPQVGSSRSSMPHPHARSKVQEETKLSYRDVTSPINQEDYQLDSSEGKDFSNYNDDSNAFSKTGFITIKSSSSSSGGLIAALRISRENSSESEEFQLHDSGVHNSSQSESENSEGAAAVDGDGESKDHKPEATKAVKADNASANGGDIDPVIKRGALESLGDVDFSRQATPLENVKPDCVHDQHNQLPFEAKYCDMIFPDVAENLDDMGCALSSAQLPSMPTAYADQYLQNLMMEGNLAAFADTFTKLQGVAKGGNVPTFSASPSSPSPQVLPGPSQRRSSCQARLLRLSVMENSSQVKDSRMRRKSANSPPTYLREYGGRGQDLGSGTGRVSCLSDIPTNPGPQAGYPVTSCSRPAGRLAREGNGLDRYQGSGQVPVAAVAPTFLPPGAVGSNHRSGSASTTLTPHPTSAFSTPQQSSTSIRKHSAPDISPGAATPDSTQPREYQSDSGASTVRNPNSAQGLPEFCGEEQEVYQGHCDLAALLEQLGLSKYAALFEEQDVDLQVFLSLTDNDLKEIGIKLFGPRKKMTNAIARWHSQAPAARSSLEQAYADRLEGEMQEMAIQLNQAYSSAEKLQAQVLQERQLRAVTEGCLMEERAGWQTVHQSLLDTQQRLTDLTESLAGLSLVHTEVKKLLNSFGNNPTTATASLPTAAGRNISSNLLSPASVSQSCDLAAMNPSQLISAVDRHLQEVEQHSAALRHMVDSIVSRTPDSGAVHDTRDVDQEFP